MRLLAAALMACGVWWWFPPRVRPTRVGAGDHAPTTRRRTIRRLSPFTACLLAAGSALVLLPGPVGIATAILVAVGGPVLLGRVAVRTDRQRRMALARQAPEAAELLAALVAAGAGPGLALDAVTSALGEPLAAALAPTRHLLTMGAAAEHAWQSVMDEPALAPIGEAFRRSSASGAPLVRVLTGVARDLRRRHLLAVQSAARSAGVSAVVPLAACFLPAFLLLGVAPVVASLAWNLVQA